MPKKTYKSLDALEKPLRKGLLDLHDHPNKVSSMTNFANVRLTP